MNCLNLFMKGIWPGLKQGKWSWQQTGNHYGFKELAVWHGFYLDETIKKN